MSSLIPQCAYVSDTGISIANGPDSWELVHSINTVPKFLTYSPNGDYVAFVFDSRVEIFNARTLTSLNTIELKGVIEAAFSPKGTYLSTWIRFVKGDETSEPHRNLSIWESSSGELVTGFSQKNQNGWNVQWTANEAFMARNVTGEVDLYDVKTLKEGTITARLRLENLGSFSLSAGSVNPTVAAFISEKKGAPASVRVFDMTKPATPLAQKSFFNADYVDFHWSADGSTVLVLTHAEVDKTGQSYYGKSSLFFLSASGAFDSQVSVGDGPIHSVNWSPNSKEFIVVHGAMPSKATLFDHRAQSLFEFPQAPRNFVKYSPHGRFIVIAGFGNLAGDMDVWDRLNFTKICSVHASNSTTCEWSPDGRYIMTATLYKRLKVDNGVKFWHYSGVLAHKVDVKEMYQVAWRFDRPELWPKRKALTPPPTPKVETIVAPPKPTGVYRPPGARGRGTPSLFTQREQVFGGAGPAAEQPADEKLSKNAIKNQKKRAAKKGGDDEATPKPATPANPTSLPAFIPTDDAAKNADIEKRLKALNKKLKSIHELKERKDKGEKLELTQLQKIEALDSVIKEIEELKLKL
ncbi:hypothetical protein HDU97_001143 [Phlyctochytrium planicorne]|nr:hypothetical protein HDU97_001143 [Phlyctochytrium planicorne]